MLDVRRTTLTYVEARRIASGAIKGISVNISLEDVLARGQARIGDACARHGCVRSGEAGTDLASDGYQRGHCHVRRNEREGAVMSATACAGPK